MLHSITQVYLAYEWIIWMGIVFASLVLITETVSDHMKQR
jgi:hypothetical protein